MKSKSGSCDGEGRGTGAEEMLRKSGKRKTKRRGCRRARGFKGKDERRRREECKLWKLKIRSDKGHYTRR